MKKLKIGSWKMPLACHLFATQAGYLPLFRVMFKKSELRNQLNLLISDFQ